MSSEIEEIVDSNDNPHNDNTKKKDNHSNNNSTDHSNSDKKEDGWKGTLTSVLCYPLQLATRRKKKKDKTVDIKSEHRGDKDGRNIANPTEPESDAPEPQCWARFKNFEPREQKCLSSFILLPENAVVKKRLLVYWWIGEGFLDDLKTTTEILDKFMGEKFILPAKKNYQKVVKSFKMCPDLHSRMTSVLAEEAKSLDSKSDALSWFHSISDALSWFQPFQDEVYSLRNQEKVTTLFNISKGSLDFKIESFPKMNNIKVLYLGRWESSAEGHHIEVPADSELLKGLKNMENLRFLSLQGISGIQELPGRSISSLGNLRILDLRACYNLEKLPNEIASLKKLTHLDISECYLLDCMPRELLSLSELQVLKGFVITDTKNSNSCTPAELAGLEKLTKLSVNLNSENFSIDNFSAVLKFDKLQKLKITWGGKFSKVNRNKKSQQENKKPRDTNADNRTGSNETLEKLELQCFPHKTLPKWVHPNNLRGLKKLYIRGGGIKTLSRIQVGNQKWEVETLRLKYLNEFNINWIELMALFPKLQIFEKFKCPKLTLCPCDCTGVWVRSSTKESPPLPQTTS
ncbi:hypothetical protein Dsin_023447 [Dipteronia sinensis]|uniref:Disease resistance R13L4/SHOC-2-like LRR domain-containing protein n=1 Tax=Dipteronia sinensis TaxID=43782 RepID=A0AAD9Z4C8_9ROSI|nr:hypothetical protein Dsin_032699 [Dipteronia sinensis]KAK3200032.1 hypothetical protein Dsin_023447 [Dipteronia sinensis]